MSSTIDFPFGLEELDKVFLVSEFLENRDELINEFRPEVTKFLVKKTFFSGAFRQEYNRMFDELIVRLIKRQLVQHFDFNPEELMLLTDTDFLKLITDGFYFDSDNYITKEANH